jgi:DNA-directed RNA polymerase subunit RPC12/RpoP
MQEPVGQCLDCGKTVFCDGGFLGGVVLEDHQLRCYDCDEKLKAKQVQKEE